MTSEPINIPVKLSGISQLKNDLKQIKNDIADNLGVLDQLTNKSEQYKEQIAKGGSAEQMERLNKALSINEQRIAQATKRNVELSASAGLVKDKMMQVNEQVATFASGSGFENASNSLGLIGSQLANLDFEGAASSAQVLQKQINGITAEEINKQMKGLTDTFSALGKVAGQSLTGLVKNIGGITKAFASFGKSLLLNPIFLIPAIFIAVGAAIALLLDKLGLLKPILDKIGQVFDYIGRMIDMVIQSIKDMLDWLGLTDYASEDSAKKQSKAAEKKADAYEKSSKRVQYYLDEEIKLAQIAGKDTTALEIKKQQSIRETAKVRMEALRAKIAENKLTKELDGEELKAIYDKLAAQSEVVRGANSELKYIKAQQKADNQKETEEAKKEAKERAKNASAAAKEAEAKRLQYAQSRLQAERQIKDIELNSLADGYEKELALNKEKNTRLLIDLQTNNNLTVTEKARFAEAYKAQQVKELDDLKKAKDASEAQAQKEAEEKAKEVQDKESELIKRNANASNELRIMLLQDGLAKELEVIEFQKELELQNKDLTENEKALIEEKYRIAKAEKEDEYRKKRIEADKAAVDAGLDIANVGLGALAGLNDLAFEMKKSKLEDGSRAEEAAAKRNFEINKKIQIAIATISGIQGVINALTASSVIPEPFGTILKAANAVAVGVSTAVNIAKIKNTKFNSSGGGGGSASSGGTPAASVTGAAPAANLYGNPNNMNNVKDAKSAEAGSSKEFVIKSVVVADEMSAKQMQEKNILANAAL